MSSPFSLAAAALVGPPAQPVLGFPTPSGTSIGITWTPAAYAHRYEVWYRPSAGTWAMAASYTAESGTLAHTLTGLDRDTLYEIRVDAVNGAGSTASAATLAETAPAAVTGASVTSRGTNSLTLSWTDPNVREAGFRIYFAGTNTVAATTGYNVTSGTAGSLQDETEYCFEVVAYNSSGESPRSSFACHTTLEITPGAPSLSATDGSSCSAGSATVRAALAITDVFAETDWTGYVQRKPFGLDDSFYEDVPGLTWVPTGGSRTLYDTNVTAGQTYTYRALYRKSGQPNSPASSGDDVLIAQPCPAPGASTASLVITGTSATLTWGAASNAKTYRVYRNGVQVAYLNAASARTHTDNSLPRDSQFSYYVKAENDADATNSNTEFGATVPFVPEIRSCQATSTSTVQVKWGLSDLDANAIYEEGFRVRLYSSGGSLLETRTVAQDQALYSWTGLNPGTTYGFRVEAFNDAGGSGYSSLAEAATPETIPAPPSLATLDQSYCNEGSEVTRMRIDIGDGHGQAGWTGTLERAQEGTDIWTDPPLLSWTPNGTSRQYTDTALVAGISYKYRARYTKTGVGQSAYSTLSNVTPAIRCTNAPANLYGDDLSRCESGSPFFEKRIRYPQATSGWESEIQGEYNVLGRWSSPNHQVHGSSCPSSNDGSSQVVETTSTNVITQRCIDANSNTYRVRRRRANAQAPSGYDTTGWGTPKSGYEISGRSGVFQIPTVTSSPCTPVITSASAYSIGGEGYCDFSVGVNTESVEVRSYRNGVQQHWYTINTSPNGGPYTTTPGVAGNSGDEILFELRPWTGNAGSGSAGSRVDRITYI